MTVTWEWLSSRACLGTFRLSMCTRQSQPAAVGVVTGFGQTLTCWQTAWLDSLQSFVLSQCSVWKNKKRKLLEGLTNRKEPMLNLALVQSQQQASHLSLVEAIIKQRFMGIFFMASFKSLVRYATVWHECSCWKMFQNKSLWWKTLN